MNMEPRGEPGPQNTCALITGKPLICLQASWQPPMGWERPSFMQFTVSINTKQASNSGKALVFPWRLWRWREMVCLQGGSWAQVGCKSPPPPPTPVLAPHFTERTCECPDWAGGLLSPGTEFLSHKGKIAKGPSWQNHEGSREHGASFLHPIMMC